MSRNMNSFIIFAVGAAIGSWVTCKVTKAKYERPEPEEDECVEEDSVEESDCEEQHITKAEYKNLTEQFGYTTRSEEGDETTMVEINRPYIIDDDEYGECDYETSTLTYYSDGVLEDEYGDLVEDADSLIGLDNLDKFEGDSLYVRNDKARKDIEILRDYQKYSDLYYTEA